MRKILLIFIIFISFPNLIYGQKKFENKEFGFVIQEPKNWFESNNEFLLKNLEKFKITDENLSKLLSNKKGSILLASFHKYNPKTHNGLIPTIQVNVRLKGQGNFDQFKNSLTESVKGFKKYFQDFELINEVSEVKISGIKSIFFVGKFTMKTQNGQEMKVRSRTYAIPYKNYFFQINFTDNQTSDDCSKEFDELVNTINIGEKPHN
ncbi:hypothetical protein [Chryseobacterium geocarposphaerae]|uniref:T-box domain-containing protein n=1 Tax=Chryseobacterium geocarposphaerae TaxID=1416776 RepID=A0A2M9C8M2_9FLAO|nr:hypothetical protein [Chryseobacterium geocarposphaerae]PJJ67179.1 hypothetical protein CLV73_1181 [Chryseobacterium geocarposphaerae]